MPKTISVAEKFKDSPIEPNLMENNRIKRKMTEEDLMRITYVPRIFWKPEQPGKAKKLFRKAKPLIDRLGI